jgi:putative transposase
MPRKISLVNDEYYHILNRGVDKREIFMNDEDRYRFLHNLYEFNDKNYVINPFSRRVDTCGHPVATSERNKLVEIICFCLMPNHFHFILKQLQENGISKFMHKLGQGYSHYFNGKYDRSGALFQGKFKSVHVSSDEQLTHLSRYIHVLNPGELVESKIREGIVSDRNKLNEFLNNYKWSSYMDYIGVKNHPSLIDKNFLLSMFKGEKDYENFVMFGLDRKNNLEEEVILE